LLRRPSTISVLDGALFREGLPQPPELGQFRRGRIAYALYRIACLRDEPRLLRWRFLDDRAARDATRDDAFVNREMELTPEIVGRISPIIAKAALHLVQALVETAAGNDDAAGHAVARFLQAIDRPCLEARPDPRPLRHGPGGRSPAGELPDPGDAMHQACARPAPPGCSGCGARSSPSIRSNRGGTGQSRHGSRLGRLRTRRSVARRDGMALPASFETRLAELFACARPRGRGLEWPWRQGAERPEREMTMPGWCNGAAGMVHLACLARRVLKDDRWLEPALGAAWQAWEAGSGPVDLCCGLSGRAHALLELHRSVGDDLWLDRARVLIDRAVEAAPHMRTPEHPRHSLY